MKEAIKPDQLRGLTDLQVKASRLQHGSNIIEAKNNRFSELGKKIIRDPMLLLLVAAGTIYFITGNRSDAVFMFAAITVVISISLYQDYRSQKALTALRTLTQPNCRVVRNGVITSVPIADIVPGDYLLAEEGSTIAADGIIVQSNDFAVNESVLTGESLPIEKTAENGNNEVFQGTVVTRGLAVCKVTAIGIHTRFGEIGRNLSLIEETQTPLQKQISAFVRNMAIVGALFFIGVLIINLYRSHNILDSLLKALSLAMSILPEEIPVAFVVFMAIGAWRLSKLGVIVKHVGTIETLGSASIICADKTGTITKNQMELRDLYVFANNSIENSNSANENSRQLLAHAMWASEPIPFDPMEIALHEAYSRVVAEDQRSEYRMIHEYPLSGQLPMMTHVFERKDGKRIIAAKGAPEGILALCRLTPDEMERVTRVIHQFTSTGARVLGVAMGNLNSPDFPKLQTEFHFTFLGLVSFYDPPKENMQQIVADFYSAGVKVKMITGDYAETAVSIAKQIGIHTSEVLTGDEVMKLKEPDLQRTVEEINIFARTFPEAKLRILNALKNNGHVVAMTGDGINDAPALKAAHIGVAMGKRGTEVAKQASAMILSDDDLSRMVDAIGAGRKIYGNLKNAIQYIISIHIPIILTVFVPLVLNWAYPVIFTPVHVIFMELIMGPTCSIVYENEPFKKEVLHQKPRTATRGFFNWRELTMSIVQGLVITIGVLVTYQFAVVNNFTEESTRALVFTMLISANIFLTFVNRSATRPFWITIGYRNYFIPVITLITITLTCVILYVRPVSGFFEVTPPTSFQLLIAVAIAFVSVTWIDLWKVIRKRHRYIGPLLVLLMLVPSAGRSQAPAWKNSDATELITAIQSVSMDGMHPDDYNLKNLLTWSKNTTINEDQKIAFDRALTQSFLSLAHDLYQGRIDPDKLFPGDWEACTMSTDYNALLAYALSGGGICETLDFLKPQDNAYEGLKYMLSTYKSIDAAGGLPVVALGDPIRPGDADERIADIRTRLAMLKLMPWQLDDGNIRYDSTLLVFVNKFQRLHGLTPDGVIGRRTQIAMQATADDYISTIVANLEKYRWHQSRLLEQSIQINIPAFNLKAMDHEGTQFEMRVIVGRTDRPTPVISSSITAMIINPTWTVPPTILKEDLLHVIKKDVGYLSRHSMRVLNYRGLEMNPDSLDWSKFSPDRFPYYIQQDPGPNNPLGRIKFMFPNHHTVYLHDTNMPSLFSKPDRALSSGCIRIESPMALVRLLLPHTGWTEQRVKDQIDQEVTKLVLVKDPLPIHLTYFTAFVENEELHVLRDLYGYDKTILNALAARSRPILD